MGITIGDNNKINNSVITNGDCTETKKNWGERHPVIVSVLASFGVGFLLLFSFWKDIITFLEGLF